MPEWMPAVGSVIPVTGFMADTFHPQLVNGPFDDPALFVSFRYKRRALLFDLGRIDRLSLREIHKLTDVFVSHTHIDHFIGFDHLLRCSLNKEDELRIYGPEGIIDNVQGKLAGYTWNLIQGYPLKIAVDEIDGDQQRKVHFLAAHRFRREGEISIPFAGLLLDEPSFTAEARVLDHSIPCLAFRLKEKNRLNVRGDRLQALGLKSGPWLDDLKRMLREKATETTWLETASQDGKKKWNLTLQEWREELILETEGQTIVYVVDCVFGSGNIEQILSLAKGADLFYCEAAFSERDEEQARSRYHLTATQAGQLARLAQVKAFVPFHFSLRYEAEPNRLFEEAMQAFSKA